MQQLGGEHIMVVHADDGLDEISLATHTHVAELKDGQITEYRITPEELGVESQSLIGLVVDSPEQSLGLIQAALGGGEGAEAEKARAMVALNAGAAIYLSGEAVSHKAGVEKAMEAIRSGAALEKMNQLAQFSQQL